MGDFGACDAATALRTVQNAEIVAEEARDFMFKPDGGAESLVVRTVVALKCPLPDVGYRLGLLLHQDPAIYTLDTEYLMPGPAGNLYSVPDKPSIRKALVDQAIRATRIFESVNFPFPPPDMLVCCLGRLRVMWFHSPQHAG